MVTKDKRVLWKIRDRCPRGGMMMYTVWSNRVLNKNLLKWEYYRAVFDEMKKLYPSAFHQCYIYNPPGHKGILRWYEYLVRFTGQEFPEIEV